MTSILYQINNFPVNYYILMNYFTLLIIILLILSIGNNFLMYKKMFMYRDTSYQDPNVNPEVGFFPVNVYYWKKLPENKCYSYQSQGNPVVDDLKGVLLKYENNNKTKCVITYGSPTEHEYVRINTLGKY
jgi:hypothetical protein